MGIDLKNNMELNKIYLGDCIQVLKTLPDESVNCCVTSPPYFGVRDYGVDNQIGFERTPQEYVSKLVDVFSEVYRILKVDGTLWLNIADTWAHKIKGNGGVQQSKTLMQAQYLMKSMR